MTHEGQCLCGACRFAATPVALEAGACHCGLCRKISGGINLAVNCLDVTWNADAPLRTYPSSDHAERVFCGICGANLYWHGLDDDPGDQAIALGAFDRPGDFAVTREIFVEYKPDTYALAGDLVRMTGAEVRAISASHSEGPA